MKENIKLSLRCLRKLFKGRAHRIKFEEGWALSKCIFALGLIIAVIINFNKVRKAFDDSKELSNLKNATTAVSASNVVTSTTIEEDAKAKGLAELKEAKEALSSLGEIRILKRDIDIKHDAKIDEGSYLTRKYAIIEKIFPTTYSLFLDTSKIEWELSADYETIYAYVDRAVLRKEDISIDHTKKPIVTKHPDVNMIDELDDSGWIEKGIKSTFNENVKGFVSVSDVNKLEEDILVTFPDGAYTQINEKVLSDPNFIKEIDDITLSVVENIYNPELKGNTIVDSKGQVKSFSHPTTIPVVAKFKDSK